MDKFTVLYLNAVLSVPLEVIGDTDETGTTTRFKADAEIFTETTEYEFDILATSCT